MSCSSVSHDDMRFDEEQAALERDFPITCLRVPGRSIACRIRGQGAVTVVLLHGIGSNSGSWFRCAERLAGTARVVAWDAPGYGHSSPLPAAHPRAVDYADVLEELLAALEVDRCILVGHSLGALMAAGYVRKYGQRRLDHLLLISPARGYGGEADRATGSRVRAERLEALETLGVEELARLRAPRLLSAHASPLAQAWVRWNMARLNPGGYRQAIELLCGDHIEGYAQPSLPVSVACGEEDRVTPWQDCERVARAFGVPLELLPGTGHASPVEAPGQVADLILDIMKGE